LITKGTVNKDPQPRKLPEVVLTAPS